MTTETLAGRVDAGAKLLDEKRPGWFREIDADGLHMWNCDDCVLGQVYDGFDNGVDELKLDWASICSKEAPYAFGFDRDRSTESEVESGEDADREFSMLADLWRAEIRTRLERA